MNHTTTRLSPAINSVAMKLLALRYAVTLALSLLLGCETVRPEQELLDLGRAALDGGDFTTAVERYTLAIETAARSRPPYFFAEGHLARGRSSLALARSALAPAPKPLSRRPFRTIGAARGLRQEFSRPLLAASEDFRKIIRKRTLPDDPARLQALALSGEVHEILGRDGLAREDYRRLAEEAVGRDAALVAEANGRLGWLTLKPLLHGTEVAIIQAALKTKLEDALSRFENALAVRGEDIPALLGKGICLARLGRYRESFRVVNDSLARSEASDKPSPLAHVYLGICIQELQGFQKEALDHLVQAMADDPARMFLEVYMHMVNNLARFLQPGSPKFHDIVRVLLEYRGLQPSYWAEVERLSEQLLDRDDFPLALSYNGLAKSRARTGKVGIAIEALLRLRNEDHFSALLDEIFPENSTSPESIYARLLVLFEVGRHKEVEDWTRGGIAVVPISEYYYRIHGLMARNLFERWREIVAVKPQLGHNPYIREYYLLAARKMLARYIQRFPDAVAARICLGEILQITGDPSTALAHFCEAARLDPSDHEIFEHLVKLHSGSSLRSEEIRVAWNHLRTFQGSDRKLVDYVERIGKEHRQRAARFCGRCGRPAAAGERTCQLCGEPVGEGTQARGETGEEKRTQSVSGVSGARNGKK